MTMLRANGFSDDLLTTPVTQFGVQPRFSPLREPRAATRMTAASHPADHHKRIPLQDAGLSLPTVAVEVGSAVTRPGHRVFGQQGGENVGDDTQTSTGSAVPRREPLGKWATLVQNSEGGQ